MGFIIGVLKVIGFILLAILLLIVFLLAVILFIPICYQISGNGRPYEFTGKVHWLFGLIQFGVGYQDGSFQTHLWYPFKKRKPSNQESPIIHSKSKEFEMSTEDDMTPISQVEHHPAKSIPDPDTISKDKKIVNKKGFRKSKKQRSHTKDKKHFDFISKFTFFKETITKEENKELMHFFLNQLKFLMKHIKPSHINADLTFSTSDPARTGELLGVLSFFPFLYRKNVSITPDFTSESPYIEGMIYLKGTLFGIHILILGIRLLANKQFRTILLNRR